MSPALQFLMAALAGGVIGGLAVRFLAGGARPPTMASTCPQVAIAHQFILLDSAGRPRATLAISDGGAVGLFLFNTDGTKPAAQFTVLSDGHQNLTFYNQDGKVEWLARPCRKPDPEDSLAPWKDLTRWN